MKNRVAIYVALACLLAVSFAAGEASAAWEEPARTERERLPFFDDPGETGANRYYRNCLTRRNNGDFACGEVCFWRECVRCENLCRCDPCDDCPEDEDDGSGGGGTGASDDTSNGDDPWVKADPGPGDAIAVDVAWDGGVDWNATRQDGPVHPLPPEQDFPRLDLGCPDHSQCPDRDCECGGGNCWAYCGDCIGWQWRFLGATGTGRYPGDSYAGFNVYPVNPVLKRGYWERDNEELFDMAAKANLLADYYVGIGSRCLDPHGLHSDQRFEDEDEHSGFIEPDPYGWIQDLPSRRTFPNRTPVVPPAGMADAVNTPEPYAPRARVCEGRLRGRLEELARGDSNRSAGAVRSVVNNVARTCGGNIWAPVMTNGKSLRAGESSECPNVSTGYYARDNVAAGLVGGTLVLHWKALPRPPEDGGVDYDITLEGESGGKDPGPLTVVLGNTPTPGPGPDPQGPPIQPHDHGACWLYNADSGWRSLPATRTYDPDPDVSYDDSDTEFQFNSRFLGFVESRPAPHMVVERLTGVIGDTGFVGGAPAWFRTAVAGLQWRYARHFQVETCYRSQSRFVTVSVNPGTPEATTAEVQVEPCWVYYRGATRVDATPQFAGEKRIYETVTSRFGTRRFPLRRFMDPLSRAGVSALREDRNCKSQGECLSTSVCPYYNHRGMLQASYTLQTFPAQAGEAVGGTRTTGIEVCDVRTGSCSNHSALLTYAGPVDASGHDADVFLPTNSANIAPSGVPWVGYRPVIVNGVLVLEYTDTLGEVTRHNPTLFGDCRPLCPYLNANGPTRNSLELEFFEPGRPHPHRVVFPGGQSLPMMDGCRYFGNGLVECGDFSPFGGSARVPDASALPHGSFGFSYDLPYPYCPALLNRGMATMENYRVPDWNPTTPYVYPSRGYTP